jgi:prevent-host-death family protein
VDVTARELKNHLGQYLAAVRRGETVRVTYRGSLVAELCPPALTASAKIDRLVAQGRATAGKGRFEPFTPRPAPRSATAIILEDRAAERP